MKPFTLNHVVVQQLVCEKRESGKQPSSNDLPTIK